MKNITPLMWRKGIILSATFLSALFVSFSCKKKINTIGQNTINQNEILGSNGTDTFSISTYTVYDDMDSLSTSFAIYGVLGSYNDPVFGTVNSEIYTEAKLKAFSPDFGSTSTITVDSVVLGLRYAGSYGKSGVQNVEVFRLGDTISLNTTYYASSTVESFGTSPDLTYGSDNPMGATTNPYGQYNFNTTNESVVGSDTLDPQLRIRLKNELGWEIINRAGIGDGAFSSNEGFKEFFKGLHIRTRTGYQSPGEGGLFYFDLNNTNSKMTIYYNQDGVSNTYDLLINSQTAKFNHVDIDQSGTNVENVVNNPALGQNQFYAQAFGSRAIVEVPGLDNIPANAVIHKATLEIPVQYQTGADYEPSADIAVTTLLEEGGYGLYSFVGYNNFNKSYSIDLRAYAQAVVNKEVDNTGLALSPVLYITSGDRIIFNGANSTNKGKPRLNIVYTEF
tara:strand:+ start:2595 stop:3941 length:1347 start_codon:yes stop_codon:yes gene_type:complete